MSFSSLTIFRPAALALMLPLLGMSAAVQINTVCYGPGSCTAPANTTDAVSNGKPVSGTFNQNVTVGSDLYKVSASYAASYNGSSESLSFNPTVTYIGAASVATNDTVKIDFFQDIYDPTPGPFSASTQTESIPLNIPNGATGSGQLFFNGTGLPLVGPFGPGVYNINNSQAFGAVNSSYLGYDYQFTFTFAAGDPTGTSSSSTTPEPSQFIPAAVALAGFALYVRRRRK